MLSVLIGAVLVMAVTAQRPVINTLLVTNGARDGEIFRDEFCPTGTYAAGFQILCEEDRGSLGDDTAMNGITVFCEPLLGVKEENEVTYGVAESFYGTWGYWRSVFYCPDNMYMVKFKLRVEGDGGISPDDTGVNNIRFTCRGFDTTDEVEITGDGETWGRFGDYSDDCALGSAICGLATEYKIPILGDNTAITDMKFYCCNE